MKVAMEKTKEWVINYFEKKSGNHVSNLDANYFDAGLIDSFGVIELVEEVESVFGIRLSEQDFQDRRFSTITGLIEMIGELKEQEK